MDRAARATDVADADVVVIGGGLLGMCVAMLAARGSADVVVCRLSDARVPHADTLRNQSWLQSGLRYVGGTDVDARLLFAKRMRAARQRLHDELGFELPRGFGVFRLRDEADAGELERKAIALGVAVQRLGAAEARAIVGPAFHVAGSPYYATPEVPFDEAALLGELRARLGDAVHEVADAVRLVPDPAPPGYVIAIGPRVLRPRSTVLAAGAGNVPLLAQLALAADLAIDRTPLLVVPDGGVIPRTRVFVDRVRQLSVVTHPPSPAIPSGAMVIGVDGVTAPGIAFVAPDARRMPAAIDAAFWAKLPAALAAAFRDRSRITAGFEVRHAASTSSSLPWISPPYAHHPGLVAAIPGRATLSMAVAADVVARLPMEPRAGPPVVRDLGAPWRAPIHMHHEPYYDHLDDC